MKFVEKLLPLLEKIKSHLPRSQREPVFLGKQIKRPILTIGGGLVAMGVGFLIIYISAAIYSPDLTFWRKRQTVEIALAERGSFIPKIQVVGTVEPAEKIPLKPKVHGRIQILHPNFHKSGFIEKGELLIQIEPGRHERAMITSQIRLEETINTLAKEKERQKATKLEYQARNEKLPPHEEALLLREPEIAALEIRKKKAMADYAQKTKDLKNTAIRLPYHAQILETNVDLGSWVDERTPAAHLANTELFHINAPINASKQLYIPQSEEPPEVFAEPENSADREQRERRSGTIHSVDPTRSLDNSSYNIRIQVSDPLSREPESKNLQPMKLGETWVASFPGKKIEDVIRVPTKSLRNSSTLWVLSKESKLELRVPEIVLEGANYTYISSGVDEGEMVILSDIIGPELGMRLRRSQNEIVESEFIPVDDDLEITPKGKASN